MEIIDNPVKRGKMDRLDDAHVIQGDVEALVREVDELARVRRVEEGANVVEALQNQEPGVLFGRACGDGVDVLAVGERRGVGRVVLAAADDDEARQGRAARRGRRSSGCATRARTSSS